MPIPQLPIQHDLTRLPRSQDVEPLLEIVDSEPVRQDRSDIQPALQQGDQPASGLEHLAAMDAPEVQTPDYDLVQVQRNFFRRDTEQGDAIAIAFPRRPRVITVENAGRDA